jgi:hypothetical protein
VVPVLAVDELVEELVPLDELRVPLLPLEVDDAEEPELPLLPLLLPLPDEPELPFPDEPEPFDPPSGSTYCWSPADGPEASAAAGASSANVSMASMPRIVMRLKVIACEYCKP